MQSEERVQLDQLDEVHEQDELRQVHEAMRSTPQQDVREQAKPSRDQDVARNRGVNARYPREEHSVRHECYARQCGERRSHLLHHDEREERMATPHERLQEDSTNVGAPRVSRPAEQLLQKGGIGLERRPNCALGPPQLGVDQPVVLREPPRAEFVVSGDEKLLAPVLAGKPRKKLLVSHNAGTERRSSAARTLAAAIENLSRGHVHKAPHEANVGQNLPGRRPGSASSHPLSCRHGL